MHSFIDRVATVIGVLMFRAQNAAVFKNEVRKGANIQLGFDDWLFVRVRMTKFMEHFLMQITRSFIGHVIARNGFK
jgi:hypothetical protein